MDLNIKKIPIHYIWSIQIETEHEYVEQF